MADDMSFGEYNMTATMDARRARPRDRAPALARVARRAAVLLCALWLAAGPAVAGPGGLHIELNKVEDNVGSCLASFVLDNDLGQTLDRFSLELYVFDRDGIIARQVLLDLAPLRADKMTVARFVLIRDACEGVGRVLVNQVPSCRAEASGQPLDCLDGLTVSSRSRIELVK